MNDERPLFEIDADDETPDPDEIPVRDRRVFTQPYDLVVESLMEQIKGETIFLRPISERPNFQRRYVWSNTLASKLIESILLNVPIPPCYLSQNEEFELDVIDGQQRLFSIYRFLNNQFPLSGLEVLTELNQSRFHEMPLKMQRQLKTHTLRCILITNESHPEIKFDVFERLNTNTVPLNSQELRNCIYRGALNDLLANVVAYQPWLKILGKVKPDIRMRDEELALRFFAFHLHGVESYRTPQKHWLNEVAKAGARYSPEKIQDLSEVWYRSIDTSLQLFEPKECFRRDQGAKAKAVNRALFDLIMHFATQASAKNVATIRDSFRERYYALLENGEFSDLINRAVDHTKRTKRRFELWNDAMVDLLI
ncbi:MAG: DUF262 domain-containing protein [Paraburkholderia sp.]|uniref:DUF262 domain-containing protein n=1 Tax=Paraburkholderia sp. TaxID=1926495 RepID=UPI003C37730D